MRNTHIDRTPFDNHPLCAHPLFLLRLCGGFVPQTGSEQLVWNPVLAFGWGTNVRFMQLIDRGDDTPVHFKTLATYVSLIAALLN